MSQIARSLAEDHKIYEYILNVIVRIVSVPQAGGVLEGYDVEERGAG